MRFRFCRRSLFYLFFLMLVFPARSYAYLDPGSGSYLIQIIVAGLLSVSFVIKAFWKRIRLFFAALFSRQREDEKNPS